jgi:membrane-bound ClpP family serine protease
MSDLAIVAVVFVIAMFVAVAIARIVRRRGPHGTEYGAGGSATVPVGTYGVARTGLTPNGVVYAAGEEWTARSRAGNEIASGVQVRVVDQDGLTLIVEPGSPRQPEGE